MSNTHGMALKYLFAVFFFLTFRIVLYAQNLNVIQDSEFQDVLNEKRKINATLNISDRWKIQIFSGNSESSKKALADFIREYRHVDATIIFQTPNYKVIAGNFRTRVDAERTLLDLKNKYPDAFLIKPDK